MPELKALRASLRAAAPEICAAVFDSLAPTLIPTAAPRVDDVCTATGARLVNDPIWKIIELSPLQAAILDLPLMQRLRRVRQLGFAHYVYPSAHHSRLEHSIGAMKASLALFDRLGDSATTLPHEFRERATEFVSVAALMHDCGHTVVSHVGERVLQRLYAKEFLAIEAQLAAAFSDSVILSKQHATPLRKKPPAASEIVSAMLVLSEAFAAFLKNHSIKNSPEKLVLNACALIVGRAYETRFGQDCYNFLKSVVSGDLDADKLDYVARDAFFAGLPVSADVHRLLSQITVATVQKGTKFDIELPFGGSNPDRYHLLGIRPSAASALEMFVMTRSYLFERIYGHHKIRATERMVERLFWQRISYGRLKQRWSCSDVFKVLYDGAGDDAVIAGLAAQVDDQTVAGGFSRITERILDRRLPMRAIAIANRLQDGPIAETGRMPSAVIEPWNQLELEMSDVQNRISLELEIGKLAKLPSGREIYLDWPVPNPIRENPDIWVIDPVDRNAVLRVNRHFAAEQLSNAYTDVKLVAWIFSEPEDRATVAAATAAVLHARYDLVLSAEAARRAKLHSEKFRSALETLDCSDDSKLQFAVHNLLIENASAARILATAEQFEATFLDVLDSPDAKTAATRLQQALLSVGLSRSYYDDYIDAHAVLRIVLRHAKSIWRHTDFKEPVPYENEKRFQDSLIRFATSDEDAMRLFKVREGEKQANGVVDVVFERKRTNARPIIVELKSELSDLDKMYEAHGGQPTQYTETECARVSILYCQFKQGSFRHIGDTLEVRCSPDEHSRHVVFCVGTKAFAEHPSNGGKHSVAVGSR